MIDEGNKTRPMAGVSGGAHRSQSAFGILGFIRFMEGYYMILITKRRKVGVIGHHSIYKVRDLFPELFVVFYWLLFFLFIIFCTEFLK